MDFRVPFNRAECLGNERDHIADVIANGPMAGGGPFGDRVAETLTSALGTAAVLPTTSCSAALEMAALLLDVGPGDEVVVPSFAFATTAGAFALRGARIVFADIRPDTMNIDESRLEALVGPSTKAIVPVHYAGVGCEMDAIMDIASRHRIAVVEDLAHGPFASYRGRHLGTFGSLATLSFHETKNFTCGEGGALAINDPGLVERAAVVYEKGTDKRRFLDGSVDRYTWRDIGGSFALAEMQAAFLLGQLEQRTVVAARRRRLWEGYHDALRSWADANGVARPVVPPHCDPSHHMYYLVMPTARARTAFIDHLRTQGILAVFHYAPLHQSDMGRRIGRMATDLPASERAGDCLVRLPFFTGMTEREQNEVIAAVATFEIGRAA